jgi:uncharacterized membrane protein YbhN (UPF0104 family)
MAGIWPVCKRFAAGRLRRTRVRPEDTLGIWHVVVESARRLTTARPGYILAALGLYVLSLFIVGARWRLFVRSMGGEVAVWRASLATLGGIAVNNLFPSGRLGGEACRIALVRQSGVVTWRQATVSAVWDRLSQVPAILILAVMAVLALKRLASNWRQLAVMGIALAALVAAGFALRWLRHSDARLGGWRERLALDQADARVFSIAVGLSGLIFLQDVLRISCAALAFGVSLSPTKVAVLSIVSLVGGLAPSLGGLGPVEGGLVAGLVAFGVDLPTAAAITAAERLISYGFSTSAGAAVVALLGGKSLWTTIRRASWSADPLQP